MATAAAAADDPSGVDRKDARFAKPSLRFAVQRQNRIEAWTRIDEESSFILYDRV